METINSKTFCNEIKMLLLELICCGSFFRERMATNLPFGLHLPEGLRLRVKRKPREKNGRVKSWGREACQRPQDFAKKKNNFNEVFFRDTHDGLSDLTVIIVAVLLPANDLP